MSAFEISSFQVNGKKPIIPELLRVRKMGKKTVDTLAIFLAELIGTAMLMFLGCMGGLSWNGQPVSQFQSSFTFGMVVMLIIQTWVSRFSAKGAERILCTKVLNFLLSV